MNSEITLLARAGKCGFLGEYGVGPAAGAWQELSLREQRDPDRADSASARPLNPPPV